MTDTTTADPTDFATDPLAASAREATEAEAKTLATFRPGQQRFDEAQTAILRQLGIEDATQADLDLFFHYCRTTGLDPFRRQIYMIGRNTKVTEWIDDPDTGRRRKVERFVTKYTIQTGIDGYRRNGREAAKALGDTLSFEGPFFTGEHDYVEFDDGRVVQRWREVWPHSTPPVAAKFVIIRNGEAFPGVVKYSEFVQTVDVWAGQGQDRAKTGEKRPNDMWDRMPCNQTAKCAEALAWRRAYPDDFAGLILEDSAQPTAYDYDQDGDGVQDAPPERRRRPAGAGVAGMRAAREAREAQRADVVDAEEVAAPQTTEGKVQETRAGAGETEEAATQDEDTSAGAGTGDLREAAERKLIEEIGEIWATLKITDPADRVTVIRGVLDDSAAEPADLDLDGLQKLRNGLVQRGGAGTLEDDVREWLNAETLRQEGIAPDGEK